MTSERYVNRMLLRLVLLLAAAVIAAAMFHPSGVAAEQDDRLPFPKPGSHKGNWSEYHGRSVTAGGASAGRPPAACAVCHDRMDCQICHGTVMPRDHTNYWRTRGHGLMAQGNRDRCFACHRQDYCIRCHSETAPRSHTASWRQRHCGWCHFGSGLVPADGCGVCHKAAPHTSAPHPVNGAMNCKACHP